METVSKETTLPNKAINENEEIVKKDIIIGNEIDPKHPLQNQWTLWFYKNEKNKLWADCLKPITTFDTVEEFWGVYNHIELASKLQSGCDYSLFKKGVQPMWEDPQNRKGGRWLIQLPKAKRNIINMDGLWLETLLCLIGEAFEDDSDDVCGAVINVRARGDKLAIWTGDSSKQDSVMRVGRKYKQRLMQDQIALGYECHIDNEKKSGSSTRSKYTL